MIRSHTNGQVLVRRQPVKLWAAAAAPGLFRINPEELVWTLDVRPGWSANGNSTAGDAVQFKTFDVAGPATFTLSATQDGQRTTESVRVTFVDAPLSGPPVVTITSPANETRLMADRIHQLQGNVIDPAGGPVTSQWIIVDGRGVRTVIGTGPLIAWQPDTTGHSGKVEILLEGSNRRGESAIARQRVFIQNPIR